MNAFTPLSAQAGAADPGKRLEGLRAGIEGRIVFTTSFGLEDQAVAHFIFTKGLDIEVSTLDTGRLFPSTYKVWEETERRYGKRIRSWHPDGAALANFVALAGINGFYGSKEARLGCCQVRKVEPLGRALAGAAAWVTGLRADQSPAAHRELSPGTRTASWSSSRPCTTGPATGRHSARPRRPVNALHASGYPSIGCEPCTAPSLLEPERAGRWWWESDEARECGLQSAPTPAGSSKAA